MSDVEKVRALVKAAQEAEVPIQDTAYRFGVNPSTVNRWGHGLGPTANRARAALETWKVRGPVRAVRARKTGT